MKVDFGKNNPVRLAKFILFYQVLESQMLTVHLYSTVSAVVEDLNPVETPLIMIEVWEG